MAKKITFKARNKMDHDMFLKPYPASENIPKWWKDYSPYQNHPYSNEGKRFVLQGNHANHTFKKCTPMLDTLLSGYIIPLWTDVFVIQSEKGPLINWRVQSREVFQIHGTDAHDIPAPLGYSNWVFKYMNTWIPITPPGYSVMVHAPYGHRNLPLHAIPAIIDSDKSLLEILPPLWVKEGFEGVIEKGTPLVQITPFKREDWKAEFDYYEDDDFMITQEQGFNGNLINHYVRNVWSKKNYK